MAFVGVPYHAQREKQNSYREFPNLIDSTKYNYSLVWQRGTLVSEPWRLDSYHLISHRSNKGEKPRENPLTLLTEHIFMFPGQWSIGELEIWILTHPRAKPCISMMDNYIVSISCPFRRWRTDRILAHVPKAVRYAFPPNNYSNYPR